MSGICGSFGPTPDPSNAESRLTRMAAGLGCGGLDKTARVSTERAAFAAAGNSSTVLAKTDGPYIAAIEGYPRWLDADLARISARAGHAIALIEGFHRLGRELPKALTSHCAFAVADLAAERLLVAIDRLATRTMCFAEPSADVVVFGATLDSVNAFDTVTPEIDLQAVFDYLYFGWISAP